MGRLSMDACSVAAVAFLTLVANVSAETQYPAAETFQCTSSITTDQTVVDSTGQYWSIRCVMGIPGGNPVDLANPPNNFPGTINDCFTHCATDTRCTSWQWGQTAQYCYLKNGDDGTLASSSDAAIAAVHIARPADAATGANTATTGTTSSSSSSSSTASSSTGTSSSSSLTVSTSSSTSSGVSSVATMTGSSTSSPTSSIMSSTSTASLGSSLSTTNSGLVTTESVTTSMTSSSTTSMYAAATTISYPTVPCPGYDGQAYLDSNSELYSIACGNDFYGNGAANGVGANTPDSTLESCLAACDNAAGCGAAVLATNTHYCYLKPEDTYYINVGQFPNNIALRKIEYIPTTTTTTASTSSSSSSSVSSNSSSSVSSSPSSQVSSSPSSSVSSGSTYAPNPAATGSSPCPNGSDGSQTTYNDSQGDYYTVLCGGGSEYEGDLQTIDNMTSFDECMLACDNTNACYAVTWTGGNSDSGSCRLKQDQTYESVQTDYFIAVRGDGPVDLSDSTTAATTPAPSTSSSSTILSYSITRTSTPAPATATAVCPEPLSDVCRDGSTPQLGATTCATTPGDQAYSYNCGYTAVGEVMRDATPPAKRQATTYNPDRPQTFAYCQATCEANKPRCVAVNFVPTEGDSNGDGTCTLLSTIVGYSYAPGAYSAETVPVPPSPNSYGTASSTSSSTITSVTETTPPSYTDISGESDSSTSSTEAVPPSTTISAAASPPMYTYPSEDSSTTPPTSSVASFGTSTSSGVSPPAYTYTGLPPSSITFATSSGVNPPAYTAGNGESSTTASVSSSISSAVTTSGGTNPPSYTNIPGGEESSATTSSMMSSGSSSAAMPPPYTYQPGGGDSFSTASSSGISGTSSAAVSPPPPSTNSNGHTGIVSPLSTPGSPPPYTYSSRNTVSSPGYTTNSNGNTITVSTSSTPMNPPPYTYPDGNTVAASMSSAPVSPSQTGSYPSTYVPSGGDTATSMAAASQSGSSPSGSSPSGYVPEGSVSASASPSGPASVPGNNTGSSGTPTVPTASGYASPTTINPSSLPSVTVCPEYDGQTFTAPAQGAGTYMVECDTACSGTQIERLAPYYEGPATAPSEAYCMAVCDSIEECVGINITPTECEYFSSLDSVTEPSPGIIALTKIEPGSNTAPSYPGTNGNSHTTTSGAPATYPGENGNSQTTTPGAPASYPGGNGVSPSTTPGSPESYPGGDVGSPTTSPGSPNTYPGANGSPFSVPTSDSGASPSTMPGGGGVSESANVVTVTVTSCSARRTTTVFTTNTITTCAAGSCAAPSGYKL